MYIYANILLYFEIVTRISFALFLLFQRIYTYLDMCIYLCIYTFTSFLFRPLFLLLWSSYWPFLLPLIIWTLAAFVFHCWSPSVPGILRSPPTCLHPCAVCPGAERAGPQHQASLLQGLWLALGNGGSGRKLEIGGEGAGARRLDPARSPGSCPKAV